MFLLFMAFAVTHVIVAIVVLDFFRHYIFGKDVFPRYLLAVGGIAGLAPDIYIPINIIINWFTGSEGFYGLFFSHSLLVVLLFLLLGALFRYLEKDTWEKVCYVIGAGIFIHLLLDCFFGGAGKTFFWPVSNISFCPSWRLAEHAARIDALILVLWIIHEEVHGKIKDYF